MMTGNPSVGTVQNGKLRRAKSLSHSQTPASSAALFIHSFIHLFNKCALSVWDRIKGAQEGIPQPSSEEVSSQDNCKAVIQAMIKL